MKNSTVHAWLYGVALALAGPPLAMISAPAVAQALIVNTGNFNPPPCDYSDQFYQDNRSEERRVGKECLE